VKIIFNDGTELEFIQINGRTQYIQGANRDCLEFQFAKDAVTFEQLDEVLGNPENTKRILIEGEPIPNEDGGMTIPNYLYENYSIRVGLEYKPILLASATDTTPDVYEQRFAVTMAQKTYAEMQQTSLQETVDLLVLESLGVL
jgi:hypothetical protein